MLFNSFEFLIFLPVVFALYWFVFNRSFKLQNSLILIASYVFYGWWNWRFLGLLLLSTLIDYSFGFWVASGNERKRKIFLWLSIVNNLLVLGIFKYYNFFAVEAQHLLEHFGFSRRSATAESSVAGRHLVLYLPWHELCDGYLPW
jgi:alginate O-acetyltransferase complex protein AlgI